MRSCPVRDMIMRRYDHELLGAPLWCTTHKQRRVFVCALELALDESFSHQHMGAIYHRGRSPNASTSESHGGGRDHVNDQELLGAPLRGMVRVIRKLDCFSAHIRLREPGKSEDKAEGVEAGGRKGRGSDDESSGAQLPKSKASVRKEVDSEERHSAVEANLLIAKEGTQMQGNG
ncbi:hypothetical protein B296_00038899 [Ensete ventricosum]|uniref:Uncharacterized protein n=1 Tax=Ensete ventricosum TaxID=4639 RepID=A0A426XYG6_ENSVE|nr:hypothetical protein B296_00038899 [Ensete ventricosum]